MKKSSQRCYLIAGLESNHNGDVALAKRMVDEAVASGYDAVKVSRKRVDTFFSEEIRLQPYFEFPELGSTYGQVLASLELKSNDLAELRAYCQGRVDFVAAPYDLDSFNELSALKPEAYQIDPPLISHTPLLNAVAKQKAPLYIAAGMCTDVEIAHVIEIIGKTAQLTLLHCVSAAPLSLENTALGVIPHLKAKYNVPVGYLDNEEGVDSSVAAFALGARVIEKPFTLDRHLRGPFHSVSAGREELHSLARSMRALEVSLEPRGERSVLDSEIEAFTRQRVSLVALHDVPAGALLKAESIGVKAGLNGLSPRLLSEIIGKKTLYDLAAGTPITFGLVVAPK